MKNFKDFLGFTPYNNDQYIQLANGFKKFYHLNSKLVVYNPVYHWMTNHFSKRKRLNSNWHLLRLLKKCEHINYVGTQFKALLTNKKNRKRFQKVFVKEMKPIPAGMMHEFYNIHKHIMSPMGHTITKFIHNGSCSVETYLTYLTSKLKELGICPHFPEFYGVFYSRLDKLSYFFDKDEEHDIDEVNSLAKHDSNYQIFTDYKDRTICQVRNAPVYFLTTEWISGDYYQKYIDDKIPDNELGSLLFSLFFTIFTYQSILGASHNDLHASNIRFRKTNNQFNYYCVNINQKTKYFRIPTFGKEMVIIDWGRGECNFDGDYKENIVFSIAGDAYGMNMPHLIKGKYKRKERPFFDIGFIIMGLLDDIISSDSEWVPILKNLFKKKNGKQFNWEETSIDMYERFDRFKVDWSWSEFFEHPWLSYFEVSKESIPSNTHIWG